MNADIAIALAVNTELGQLRVTFSNRGDSAAVLRHIFEPTDVIIENDQGKRAEYYLSFPYGSDVETFCLDASSEQSFEINLAGDFIYPSSGNYRAWIEYDTTRKTAKYSKSILEPVKASSNEVRFPIELPSPST